MRAQLLLHLRAPPGGLLRLFLDGSPLPLQRRQPVPALLQVARQLLDLSAGLGDLIGLCSLLAGQRIELGQQLLAPDL